jgi:ubiquinone/menaquinone biosynthesis C-methylase UbiE
MTPPLVRPSGLHSVHPGNHPLARLYFLDAENRKPELQAAKQRSLARLALQPGARVLDVGCGPGDDARALAAVVGPTGRVLGIDVDAMMLEEAGRRSQGSTGSAPAAPSPEFRLGDVYAIDEADAAFDACRAERVFLHLAEPARALAEMLRVLAPGGRLVIIDRDIETRTIDAPDRATTRAILNAWCDGFLGGWIGRALPRLYREAGLVDVAIEPFTVIDTDYDAYLAQYDLPRVAAHAETAGAISVTAKDAWLAALADSASRGSFFASMTCFIVSGRKPAR